MLPRAVSPSSALPMGVAGYSRATTAWDGTRAPSIRGLARAPRPPRKLELCRNEFVEGEVVEGEVAVAGEVVKSSVVRSIAADRGRANGVVPAAKSGHDSVSTVADA